MPDYLNHATESALQAGEVLKKYWGKLLNIKQKGFAWDLVTEADDESERVILDLLKNLYPTHSICSEEYGILENADSDYCWMVDPLDGTTNYTHQYPWVSISIALLFKGAPIAAVVYNPIMQELFQASKGKGALLNGKRIQVSQVASLEHSLLATGFAYDRKENTDNNYVEFCHITQHSQGVRRGGSAALDLAYVAAGRLDGFWERGLKTWDIAAGVLLIEEAGGKVTSYEGQPVDLATGRLLASNGNIHEALIKELKQARQVQ